MLIHPLLLHCWNAVVVLCLCQDVSDNVQYVRFTFSLMMSTEDSTYKIYVFEYESVTLYTVYLYALCVYAYVCVYIQGCLRKILKLIIVIAALAVLLPLTRGQSNALYQLQTTKHHL